MPIRLPIPKEENHIIYEGKYWTVVPHKFNQSYLGRCIVYLHSREIDNPLQLTSEEQDEFWFDILPKLEGALNKAFHPDRLNYSHLANEWHHVHWHIVPRYEKNPVRTFAGERFIDEKVGHNYAGVADKLVSDAVLKSIQREIQKHWNKS